MFDDTQRDWSTHLGIGQPNFFVQFSQYLRRQIGNTVRPHGARVHAAGRRQLPHAGLVDRTRRAAPDRDPAGTAQHPANGKRPNAEGGKQAVVLDLRDEAAIFRQVAFDHMLADAVDAEDAAVEQPAGIAVVHTDAGGAPQSLDLGVQRCRQFGHCARHAHHDIGGHIVDNKSVHRPFLPVNRRQGFPKTAECARKALQTPRRSQTHEPLARPFPRPFARDSGG